jgi:hypothetical protein
MIFDESIRIPPLWLSEDQYGLLNQNREEYKNDTSKNEKAKGLIKSPESDEANFGFCHQCKQRKSGIILAK